MGRCPGRLCPGRSRASQIYRPGPVSWLADTAQALLDLHRTQTSQHKLNNVLLRCQRSLPVLRMQVVRTRWDYGRTWVGRNHRKTMRRRIPFHDAQLREGKSSRSPYPASLPVFRAALLREQPWMVLVRTLPCKPSRRKPSCLYILKKPSAPRETRLIFPFPRPFYVR